MAEFNKVDMSEEGAPNGMCLPTSPHLTSSCYWSRVQYALAP